MNYWGQSLFWHRVGLVCLVQMVVGGLLLFAVFPFWGAANESIFKWITLVVYTMGGPGVVLCSWRRDYIFRQQQEMMRALSEP